MSPDRPALQSSNGSGAVRTAEAVESAEAAMEAITHNKTDGSYRLLVNGDCDLVLACVGVQFLKDMISLHYDVDYIYSASIAINKDKKYGMKPKKIREFCQWYAGRAGQ